MGVKDGEEEGWVQSDGWRDELLVVKRLRLLMLMCAEVSLR